MRLAPGLERPHGAAHERAGAGLDARRVKLCVDVEVRPGAAVTSTIAVPGPAAVTGMATGALAAGVEPDGRAQGVRRHDDRPADVEIEGVVAGRPLDIVDLHEEARLVADREEARQRAGEHDRIAHDHVGAGAADPVLRPGDRHDAHGAVEGRDVEVDLGGAVRRRP